MSNTRPPKAAPLSQRAWNEFASELQVVEGELLSIRRRWAIAIPPQPIMVVLIMDIYNKILHFAMVFSVIGV